MRRRWHQTGIICPRSLLWLVWSFMFSWCLGPLCVNQFFFYCRHDPMLLLEINPIVGFMTNYLYLVVLGYLGGFLPSKPLTGWPLAKFSSVLSALNITRWDPPGQLLMPALILAITMSFLLLVKLNQSNKQSFSQGIKSPTIMGWIYEDNTRLW